MASYPKKAIRNTAEFLAKKLGIKFGDCWTRVGNKNKATIGCWNVDCQPTYGGCIMTEISTEGGGESHPLGGVRLKKNAFIEAMKIAEQAVMIAKGDTQHPSVYRRIKKG